MKTISIQFNYPQSQSLVEHAEIKDAINELILENQYDFFDKGIVLDYKTNPESDYSLMMNQEEVDLVCRCKDDENDCHCSTYDKLRKALFNVANLPQSGCGCGGNCGCN